ncbi:MAG: thermonuclease family protein [Sterolibacteriaceae bacterium]|uniref:Thermonuclease family protein n=1 Tax=Candidatus Methylophosphatis roskildensis TaxID=2899263 RepID=A0A9D7E5R8_9PROT|nr:thermonuclease family protein [Candidatus Methylophosphatis roskildensis]MBK7236858.1 thermonuclease family protein [Sterolibacteriaceae bacterium]
MTRIAAPGQRPNRSNHDNQASRYGDTLSVVDSSNTQHRIRLAGIDSPEKGQSYGRVSRQRLTDTVFIKTVQVEWTKHDRYGRIIGKVLADGRDVCLPQIQSGLGRGTTRSMRRSNPSRTVRPMPKSKRDS